MILLMHFSSKTFWYQKFQFLPWQLQLLRLSNTKSNFGVTSFLKFLRTILGFSKLDLPISSRVLVARILCQQGSYTYLATQNKFTILKPKFNLIFPLKSVLLFSDHVTVLSLSAVKVKQLINQLSIFSLKETSGYVNTKKFVTTEVYLKFKPLVLAKSFFLVRVFPRFLSTFQQKINFYQFQIFLKKLL